MSAREIKDLCIAREALSRFPGNENVSYRLEELVDTMIQTLKEELAPKPKPDPITLRNKPTDDEIPF